MSLENTEIEKIENDNDIETPEEFTQEANELKEEVSERLNSVKEEKIKIDTEKIKKEDDEPITINVKSGGISGLRKFVGKETKQHELAEDKEEEEEEDGKELIGKYISEDEYKLIASVLIILVDTVVINVFKFWSGDKRDSQFGLSKSKKNELTDILGQILKKHNVKWSLELLFVFMLVLGYAQSARNAYEFRKEFKEKAAAKGLKRAKVEDEDGKEHEVSEEEIAPETRGAKRMTTRNRFRRKSAAEKKEEVYDNAEQVA